ncbi:fructose bisphosphate aldolase [Psychromonas sp. Urea-02u-13]|uniref:fructose bisphosphate aldolase n=1 Tax=Psychromonas sp. Urea-02u-13 TaxID=2058326 RepID=UPI000C32D033|nr:fructose bisphosphate aldolase [Psychromonas sp. Urea-02u-13]PKG40605.1 fructose bisphosphate aldolase [Psychromonas sp. Urea-02u-13]
MQTFEKQLNRFKTEVGFIAALDQSGGSTPTALKTYGVNEDAYNTDEEMFDLVHKMRSRIITSSAFDGERVLGAILFENTLDREIEGKPSSQYLWQEKNVVPLLKVDKGLEDEVNGVQLMKAIPGLDVLLKKAKAKDVFGTKMRSVVKLANAAGIAQLVDQQFEVAKQICAAGLVPIIEPEVDINSPEKAAAEVLLKAEILKQLALLSSDELVMLKLSLPEVANFYQQCIGHANVVKVVALSGGFPIDEANRRLRENNGIIASFSRVLTDNLFAEQADNDFDAALSATIEPIYIASKT